MDSHTPQDGDVIRLSPHENATRAEFVNSDGRIAWRLYDRHSKGILILEDEMKLLAKLINNALAEHKDGK